jgi:acyl-coenzyme A thioesterase PaaI-like protein
MTSNSLGEARNAATSISGLTEWSGLELVAGLADGSIRPPSVAETLPFTLLPPEVGKVELWAVPEARFCNLTNTIHGGWIMTTLGAAMALAAQTTLAPGEICPSHETSAKFVRPIFIASGEMRITAHVVPRTRTVITLEGRSRTCKASSTPMARRHASSCADKRRSDRHPKGSDPRSVARSEAGLAGQR